MDLNNTQRRFAVMGDNTFKIANKLMQNKRICRLLKYQTKDPFLPHDPITGKAQPDVDGVDLIHKQILISKEQSIWRYTKSDIFLWLRGMRLHVFWRPFLAL